MISNHKLHDRRLGLYPVSAGTSVALQHLFENYTSYDLFAVNVRTVLRNLLGSVNGKVDYVDNEEMLTSMVIEEMLLIYRIVRDKTGGRLKIVFYTGLYTNKHVLFPHLANIKAMTAKQQSTAQLEVDIVCRVAVALKEGDPRGHEYKCLIELTEPPVLSNNPFARVLLLTHLPTDVLFVGNASLAIVESHTGAIKTQSELNTKLHGKPELIPFNLVTVQVMGDTGAIVKPSPLADRNLLQDLASRKGWSPMTTLEQVKQDIADDANPILMRYIR